MPYRKIGNIMCSIFTKWDDVIAMKKERNIEIILVHDFIDDYVILYVPKLKHYFAIQEQW
jgi:uncharacterized protein YdeI (YjbR/CyaY-like superfamily)